MTARLLAACLAFSLSLAAGQLLFKLAAEDIKVRLSLSWLHAATSGWLIGSLVLYAFSTALWIWVLAQMPLNKAYPFALIGAALVPLMATLVLHESLSPSYILGMAMVIAGVFVIQVF